MYSYSPDFLSRTLTRAQRVLLINFQYDDNAQTDKATRRNYVADLAYSQGTVRQSDSGLRTRRLELQRQGLVTAVGQKKIRGRMHTTFAITDLGRETARMIQSY